MPISSLPLPALRAPWVAAALLAAGPTASPAQLFTGLWQVGFDDNTNAEFSQESFFSNPPPGSPAAKDDDFYVPDEPLPNYERAITSGDQDNRIHFDLTADQASDARMRVAFDLMWGGSSAHGWGSHDIQISFNGAAVTSPETVVYDRSFEVTFDATGAVAGDNYVQISRVGGTPSSWIQFDYVRLDIDDDALEDGDGDGLPLYFEETFNLDDSDGSDAAEDPDGDGESNAAEFAAGTNPTDPDSDNDGLGDGDEAAAGTDPLARDSDGDTIPDGAESAAGTDPLDTDTDGDGSPDPYELTFGSDPDSGASTSAPLPGTIGLNFRSTRSFANAGGSGEIVQLELAGAVPQIHWNNAALHTYNTPVASVMTNLVDGSGANTSATATVIAPRSWATSRAANASPDGRLYSGYLDTDDGLGAAVTTVEVAGVPFSQYHVFVYVGADVRDRTGAVLLDNDPSSITYYLTDTEPPFPGFKVAPATATSAGLATRANVVVYRDLTASTFKITSGRVNPGDNVGVHGIQIVDATADGDGDSVPDYHELVAGTDPFSNDAGDDPDGDGVDNGDEFTLGTDPLHPDTDGDALADGAEVAAGTDPLDPDSDDDGLRDGTELAAGPFATDPLLADTDSDGDGDAVEVALRTDPRDASVTPGDLAVPVYSEPGGTPTWTWTVDDLRVLWDHRESLLRVNQWDDILLFATRVRLDTGPTTTGDLELTLGVDYRHGALTWYVTSRRGVWSYSGNNYYAAEWDGVPDSTAAFGFSGFGGSDWSAPLRFRMTAVQPNPAVNSWTLTFDFEDVTNPGSPVVVHSHTRTGMVAEHASLLDGSASWEDSDQVPDRSYLYDASGVTAGLFANGSVSDPDGDLDGMDDAWESTHGVGDPDGDPDGDGVTNRDEFLAGTDPNVPDSDADGADDGDEIAGASDPGDAGSVPPLFGFLTLTPGTDDLDGNGLADVWEAAFGAAGLAGGGDADSDGFLNSDESIAGTDPFDPASNFSLLATDDGDSLLLSWPFTPLKVYTVYGAPDDTTPSVPVPGLPPPTTEGDRMGVLLPGEVLDAGGESRGLFRVGVDDADTDGDGVSDYAETLLGTDPGLPGAGSSPDPANSSARPVTAGDGTPVSGDYRTFVEHMAGGSPDAGYPGGGPTSPGAPSRKAAARFLTQATFGPTLASIDDLVARGEGAFEEWIDDQIENRPATLHRPYVEYIRHDFFEGDFVDKSYNYDQLNENFLYGNNATTPFARAALLGSDQLRQRVAWALAQILVVSRQDAALENRPLAIADFHDILVRHAFGSYEDILYEASLHPTMGWYLSHIGNQKADPSIPRFPDENYAREIMQLFTIGLWKLNPDGSQQLDGESEPVPTYGNAEITQLARVFTGLWYDVRFSFGSGGWDDAHYGRPMRMFPEHHDFDAKTLLDGFAIPARAPSVENGLQDIRDAVGHLFNHPNTAVYVPRQLIQFLVTANPSPGYIERVHDVFVDDGEGRRGNLGAVVKAILLDPEAREPSAYLTDGFGKLREPVLRTFALARALGAGQDDPDFVWWNWSGGFYEHAFQEPSYSPSVFNFYTPVYQAPGDIRESGLVSPVFQITDTFTSIAFPNLLWDILADGLRSSNGTTIEFDYAAMRRVAGDPEALLDAVDLLFCAGQMSVYTRGVIRDAMSDLGFGDDDRIALACYLAAVSPDGAVQR